MQHEVLTQRAAEPCRQVMMFPATLRTGGPLVKKKGWGGGGGGVMYVLT